MTRVFLRGGSLGSIGCGDENYTNHGDSATLLFLWGPRVEKTALLV